MACVAATVVAHAVAIVLAWQTVADEKPELDIAPAVLQAVMLAPTPIATSAPEPAPVVRPPTPVKPIVTPKPLAKKPSARPKRQTKRQTQRQTATPVKPLATSKTLARASSATPPPTVAAATKAIPAPTPTVQLPLSDAAGLNNKPPMYPKMSRKLKEQGRVILLLLVKADGTVAEVRIQRSSGFGRLDQAALHAVKRWTFIPAKQQGKAIDYWYEMPLNFTLNP
jgi:protein TonB